MADDWIKNPTNQVSRYPGGFIVQWRGALVYNTNGRPMVFSTEHDARAYLGERDAIGR